MTWKKLLADRRVATEPVSKEEIESLRELARRSQQDAGLKDLSFDGRFDRAYSAAHALATLVIRASGYRAMQPSAQHNTFLALEEVDRALFTDFSAYFDTCRTIRNEVSYEAASVVSEAQLTELLEQVKAFESVVNDWLGRNYPSLA
jgi:hypothetical protein